MSVEAISIVDTMKLALEALKRVEHPDFSDEIIALRQAIDAAEQHKQAQQKQSVSVEPVQIAGFDVVIDESMPPNKFKFEQAHKPKCNPHPKAPHGFNRNASHANDRYTCECEGWDAYDAGYQAGIEAALEKL